MIHVSVGVSVLGNRGIIENIASKLAPTGREVAVSSLRNLASQPVATVSRPPLALVGASLLAKGVTQTASLIRNPSSRNGTLR